MKEYQRDVRPNISHNQHYQNITSRQAIKILFDKTTTIFTISYSPKKYREGYRDTETSR